MWLDIYPKFGIRNINGVIYDTDELKKFYNEYNFKEKQYIQLFPSDKTEISIKDIVGFITDMRLKSDSSCYEAKIQVFNTFEYIELKNYVLSTLKTGVVHEDKTVSLDTLLYLYLDIKKNVMTKEERRKDTIKKLLNSENYEQD